MVNSVSLIGNVGNIDDGKVRYMVTKKGYGRYFFSLALSDRKVNPGTETIEKITTWLNIKVWGKAADYCNSYLSTGSLVYVGGKISQSEYKNREGVTVSGFEIDSDKVQILSKKNVDKVNSGSEEIPF